MGSPYTENEEVIIFRSQDNRSALQTFKGSLNYGCSKQHAHGKLGLIVNLHLSLSRLGVP